MPRSYLIGRALVLIALTASLVTALSLTAILAVAVADWAERQNQQSTTTTTP